MPDEGKVTIRILKAEKPFSLKLRIPRWAVKDGKSYYKAHENVKAGDVFQLDFPFSFKVTRYTGGEEMKHLERYAVEYGPLLYGVLGAPNPLTVTFDPEKPEEWLSPLPGEKRMLALKNDDCHAYMAYLDIQDEPFDVYPAVKEPKREIQN